MNFAWFVNDARPRSGFSAAGGAVIFLASLMLAGCFDADHIAHADEVHSASDRRIGDDAYPAWEFKYTRDGSWDISCRPRSVWSELGLSFWTDLSPCGREGAGKAFEGRRWGRKILVVVYRNGEAQVMAATGEDVLVYDLSGRHTLFHQAYSRH